MIFHLRLHPFMYEMKFRECDYHVGRAGSLWGAKNTSRGDYRSTTEFDSRHAVDITVNSPPSGFQV